MKLTDSNINPELARFFRAQDVELVKFLTRGHGFCDVALVRCILTGTQKVLKYGKGVKAHREVSENIEGFKAIGQTGAKALTPPFEETKKLAGYWGISLPFLGSTITETVQHAKTIDWQAFETALNKIISTTITSASPKTGLVAYIDTLKPWWKQIAAVNPKAKQAITQLAKLDLDKFYQSSRSSLILCDFTPDNLFMHGSSITFIDPWLQDSYMGSILPSLGQFQTLYTDIYGLPDSESLNDTVQSLSSKLGPVLDLSPEHVMIQLNLGKVMQLTLSCLVRLESAPTKAKEYMNQALELLHSLPTHGKDS